jgi:uroporphyrinogen decarboxylase
MILSSRERVLQAIQRAPTDCVPAAPFMFDVAAAATGMNLREYYTRPESLARAQLALQRLVGQDVISVGADNYYIAEGFGCQTTRREDELPALVKPAVSTLAGVFQLAVPDPATQGRMPMMLEAIRLVRRAVGESVAIRAPGTGPFSLASYLIGTQQWLTEIGLVEAELPEANEAAVRRALELSADALIRFGRACHDAGADIVQCGDSLASCDVIAPATYRRFAFPYQQRVFRAWREDGIQASLLHICGNATAVLEDYRETGADLIEIDSKVDLGTAKRRIGDRVALIGNVDTTAELLNGSCETVRAATARCIQQAGGPGFILGSGCLVPRRTPLENICELVRVAHEHRYETGSGSSQLQSSSP